MHPRDGYKLGKRWAWLVGLLVLAVIIKAIVQWVIQELAGL